MQNARLGESQVGMKIARRSNSSLRYGGDIALMAESKELKGLLMRVKEEREVKEESGEAGLKLCIQKLRSWHPVPSLQTEGKKWAHDRV